MNEKLKTRNYFEQQKVNMRITARELGELMCMLPKSRCSRMKDTDFNCEECPARQLTDLEKAFLINLDKYDGFENLYSKFWNHIYTDTLAENGIMTLNEAKGMISTLKRKCMILEQYEAVAEKGLHENKYFTLTEWGKEVLLELRPDLATYQV